MPGRESSRPAERGRKRPWPAGRRVGPLVGGGVSAVLFLALHATRHSHGWSLGEILGTALLAGLFVAAVTHSLAAELRRRGRLLGATLEELDRLDGHAFEGWVAERLRRDGFAVSRTRRTGDFGLDLVAEGAGRRIGIEVKRHDRSIPNAVVRSVVSGCQYHGCNIACVVTQSRFTRGAVKQAARADLPVLLVARDELPALGPRLWQALRA